MDPGRVFVTRCKAFSKLYEKIIELLDDIELAKIIEKRKNEGQIEVHMNDL